MSTVIKKIKERLYFLKRWYRFVFLYPREHIETQESLDYDVYWEKKRGVGEGKGKTISENEKLRADYVARTIGKDPVSIGDIASGPGVIYEYLKQKLTLKEFIGYEYSLYARNVAQSLGMDVRPFDIYSDTDLEDVKEADYMLMLEILEHIPHSEKVLAIMYKKAKRGVFLSFPNSADFLYRLRVLFGKMPAQWVSFPNEHLRFWSYQDLKWWLKAQGYEKYEIYGYRGIPILERVLPGLFAGSFVVFIPKA